MSGIMNAVLERVLSQELGRQQVWLDDDKSIGYTTESREKVIEEIKSFMKQEGIKFREDFYMDGIAMAEAKEVR